MSGFSVNKCDLLLFAKRYIYLRPPLTNFTIFLWFVLSLISFECLISMDKPSDANSAANFAVSWPKARPFGLGRFSCKRQRLVTTTVHYANDNHLYAERFDCFTHCPSEYLSLFIAIDRPICCSILLKLCGLRYVRVAVIWSRVQTLGDTVDLVFAQMPLKSIQFHFFSPQL